MAILFIEFIKMIPVSLVSCSLWHHRLQSVAFPPIVSQLHWQLLKLSILNTSKSLLNSTDVCTFLSMNNFHLPMNVSQRQDFCSQEHLSPHTYLHWHSYYTLCLWAQFRSLYQKKFKVWPYSEGKSKKLNTVHFVLYMCFSYMKQLGDITS